MALGNTFELIEKYLPGIIDEYFVSDSKTAILEQGSKFIDVSFKETGYVKIASMLMDGLSDYYRVQEDATHVAPEYAAYAGNLGSGVRDGFAIGGVDLKWDIYKLQYCRGRQFRIDYISNEETAQTVIGGALELFNKTKVIPEVDATRFSLMADAASVTLGNLVTESPSSADILSKFIAAFTWLNNHEVPSEQQIIFVSETTHALLMNSSELSKYLIAGQFKAGDDVTFEVTKFMGRPIISVPDSRFYTNVLVGDNGFRPQSTSKAINYIVCSQKAIIPIRKLEWNKMYDENMSGLAGFHGYLINYLLYHGVVIPKNKVTGVFVSVGSAAATSVVKTLELDVTFNAAGTKYTVRNVFTNPVAMKGTLVYANEDTGASAGSYKKAGFTLGSTLTGTSGSDYNVAALGSEIDLPTVAGTVTGKVWFGYVDASGKIVGTAKYTLAE